MYIIVYCTLVLVSYDRHSLCHIDIKHSNRYHHTGNARNFIHRAFCSKVLPSLGINSSAPTVLPGLHGFWGDLNNVAVDSVDRSSFSASPSRPLKTWQIPSNLSNLSNWDWRPDCTEKFGKHLENVWECQTCQRLHVLEPMHRPVILGQKLAMHSWHFTVCALWLTVTPENTSLATLPLQIRQADLKVFDGTNILQILIQLPANIIK
jgi:hypothetical protein